MCLVAQTKCPDMETDHQLYELFRKKPRWFEELSGVLLPLHCRCRSISQKKCESRSDLVYEPLPTSTHGRRNHHTIVEFQFYFDQSIFERIGLARHLLWRDINPTTDCQKKSFHPRPVRGVVIFNRKSNIPKKASHHPDIEHFLLEDLLINLRIRNPDSLVLDILAPLHENRKELEKSASKHYDDITKRTDLDDDERELAEEIFLNFLIQRFKGKNTDFISKMIADLPPISKTVVGKELIEQGIERGIDKGIEQRNREIAFHLKNTGSSVEHIAEVLQIPVEKVQGYLKEEK